VQTELSGGILEEQLQALREIFPNASIQSVGGGPSLVTVPDVSLPSGWNQLSTTVYFLAPAGFPMAKPDCFWADASLRLTTGAMPQNSGMTPIPGLAQPQVWFSWHLQTWNPVSDSLITFVRVVQDRFLRRN
jgi:hypothetical protein